ncbi:unnamed protein product [Rotaria socialis]|uniref:Uncharacterized protein n=1 Tax=Rotaria socialis TaxID=392032 RepID=A0A819AVS5_9BILA|nr:unnamed protein product [Rotaria socialis]CAF4665554.1 unnamed protein product [Rotaria socialis]
MASRDSDAIIQKKRTVIDAIKHNLQYTVNEEKVYQLSDCTEKYVIIFGWNHSSRLFMFQVIRDSDDISSECSTSSLKDAILTTCYVKFNDEKGTNICVLKLIDTPALQLLMPQTEGAMGGTQQLPDGANTFESAFEQHNSCILSFASQIDLFIYVCEDGEEMKILPWLALTADRKDRTYLILKLDKTVSEQERQHRMDKIAETNEIKAYFDDRIFCLAAPTQKKDENESNNVNMMRSKFLEHFLLRSFDKKYEVQPKQNIPAAPKRNNLFNSFFNKIMK